MILIIEDDPLVAEALVFVIQDFGYTAASAPSEDAAVDLLERQAQVPSMIISDWRLADGRTGGEAIARIRGLFSDAIPAIVLTGESSPTWFQVIQDLGLDVFLKPVEMNRLRMAIEAAVGPPAKPA